MKSKTGSKLTRTLLFCFGAYITGMFALMMILSSQSTAGITAGNYDKMSVDDSPEFILTDRSNGCRYVYDSVTKTAHTATGFDYCLSLRKE
ncbi:hypothetical protein RAY_84 [Erwinia phage vB_EamM_RAY]|uniref:Transmembrane protein n=3 Tax=Agricanvirus TaxID=1984776 RepID=A0A173GEC6_9CAUD|nr:hypothetical protein FDH98_gp084 [Erwinia phage vB_EamM_RAY]YP_009605871.1 hypothetical protein FDH99_gp087 [Erwinia phage vB_EamM_Simmy50]ANH51549.1 hypothetical protein SIMMY50_87 [Erwinia phage vB_EamM_Simmy50]ANH51865.1 hypothetical protein RAY_84 [Erwinia phage vB_EamM_RAY]QBP07193.1 hypothetical protein REBECCA_86 [Erwinia phage Rebecca]